MSEAEIRRNLWDRAANTWRRLVDSATVAWNTSTPGVASASVPNGGIGTGQLADGAVTTAKIGDNQVTNAKLADMAAWTLKMRNAGTTGDPQDVTIDGLTAEATLAGAADFVPFWDTSAAAMRKALLNNLRGFTFFESAQQTITSAGTLTIAHGLGAIPQLVKPVLQCVTNDGGYTAGAELVGGLLAGADLSTGRGIVIVPDATNLNVRYGSDGTVFEVLNFGTGGTVGLTNGNWRLVLRAWRF